MKKQIIDNGVLFLVTLSLAVPQVTAQTPQPQREQFRVLGDMTGPEVVRRLIAMGDANDAQAIVDAAAKPGKGKGTPQAFTMEEYKKLDLRVPVDRNTRPYLLATRAFGYLSTSSTTSNDFADVVEAGNIQADTSLRGQSIRITLDRLRVYDYPGRGVHSVLFYFSGRHQAEGKEEFLHFTQTYRAPEGQGASINGVPVFVGLKVGSEGVVFNCKTVNVSSSDDKKLIEFLEGDMFKRGMELIGSANPLVPIVAGFAQGITKQLAARSENAPVQDIDLGLDFSSNRVTAKLREGTYIAVQAPDGFEIVKCQYNPSTGDFVLKQGHRPIPYNYVAFSIARMSTTASPTPARASR